MAMPEKALKKVILHFLHNSMEAFCECVKAPSGDVSSELKAPVTPLTSLTSFTFTTLKP